MRRTAVAVAVGIAAAGSLALVGQASAANVPADCTANGPGALAAAIAAASPGDTVQVTGTCAGGVAVNKNLTIDGVADTPTVVGGFVGIRATGPVSVLTTNLKVTGASFGGLLALSGASLQVGGGMEVTGNARYGVAAQDAGTSLSVNGAIVSSNGVGPTRFGGIITITGAGLSVNGAVVTGNTGGTPAGSSPTGGGITKDDGPPLTIAGSVISNNTSTADGGGVRSRVRTTISGTTISGNSAAGNGGGIHKTRIAPLAVNGVLNLSGTVISGNSAGGTGGGVFKQGGPPLPSAFQLLLGGNVVNGNTPNNLVFVP